ncbi:hypothetical protein QBC43DRAFT_133505 [Cladorrhinum sp. PSN259]|nr:hypothetical protein QBC43DRAFT_133505 [Cladorrhinum sp. PSN259]
MKKEEVKVRQKPRSKNERPHHRGKKNCYTFLLFFFPCQPFLHLPFPFLRFVCFPLFLPLLDGGMVERFFPPDSPFFHSQLFTHAHFSLSFSLFFFSLYPLPLILFFIFFYPQFPFPCCFPPFLTSSRPPRFPASSRNSLSLSLLHW